MARSRHEAAWTADESLVKGRVRRNKAWVLLLLVAAGATLIGTTWWKSMNFQSVTYQLRVCAEPLTKESSWAQVQQAACDPAPISGNRLTLWAGSDEQEPASSAESSWTFTEVPLNTALTAIQINLADAAQTVVLAEPDNKSLRRSLTGDAAGQKWTANVGSRGPTSYWILVTPQP